MIILSPFLYVFYIDSFCVACILYLVQNRKIFPFLCYWHIHISFFFVAFFSSYYYIFPEWQISQRLVGEKIYTQIDRSFFCIIDRTDSFLLSQEGKLTHHLLSMRLIMFFLSFSNMNSFYYLFCPLFFINSFSSNKKFRRILSII